MWFELSPFIWNWFTWFTPKISMSKILTLIIRKNMIIKMWIKFSLNQEIETKSVSMYSVDSKILLHIKASILFLKDG
jgi:hypothetical protein